MPNQEQISNIKINMAELNKDIKYVKQALEKHIEDQRRDFDKIMLYQQESIDKMEAMYQRSIDKKVDEEKIEEVKVMIDCKANKWVENVVKSFLIVFALGVLTVIGDVIYKAVVFFSKTT